MQLKTSAKQSITLEQDLAGGGEARIWTVQGQANLVAKVYHQPSSQHTYKLQAMLVNPPQQPTSHATIAWPTELLYYRQQFKGYLMPKVAASQPLFKVYSPAQLKQSYPHFTWQSLHRVAYNLATAMATVHAAGHVVGDVNESNVLVNDQALITLVDTDSFQIRADRATLYRCTVGKAEYTPPELQGVSLRDIDRAPHHDLFGLAALIFQLLMNGWHPFAGKLLNLDSEVGRVDLYGIKHGLFPYHPNPMFAPNPHAPDFAILHPEIQAAFLRCFVHSYTNPTNRPTAREWAQFLAQAERTLIPCQRDSHHVYPHHLGSCPWCLPLPRPTVKPSPQSYTQTPLPPPLPPPSWPAPFVATVLSPPLPPPSLSLRQRGSNLFNRPLTWVMMAIFIYGLGSVILFSNKEAAAPPISALMQPMIRIPAGNFIMGSDTGPRDEKPAHTVYLADYDIDKYEVTNIQYAACVKIKKCKPPYQTTSFSRDDYYDNPEFANYPVIYIDWQQAKSYCEYANRRLPTEAEWEKAARGTDGQRYPWGSNFDETKLNYCTVGCRNDTAPVDSYKLGQSQYGVYNLSGNVWEWVSDYYDEGYYHTSPPDNPENNTPSDDGIVRGGSVKTSDSFVYSAYRNKVNLHESSYDIGFRCARSVSPTPTPKPTATPIDDSAMIHIPAGEFIMGSDTKSEAEKPAHTVYLADYEIDKYETTNAQYIACVNAGKCEPPHETKSQTRANYYGNAQFANYPVINIDWTQAKSYCEFVGKRLPTEAEWEKAARGTDGRTYPWGNEHPSCDRLNYDSSCKGDTTPIGSYPRGASPYGVMDMAGNVWEWVSSDYKPYPYKSNDGREELLSNNNKVVRGGSWGNIGIIGRVTFRGRFGRTRWIYDNGFRCARSVDPTPKPTTTPTLKPISPTATDNMILIPAGEFIMGNNAGDEDEKPAHTVYLADYDIDKYEITNAQYAACVNAAKCEPPHETKSLMRPNYYGNAEFANYPVITIDWTQTKSYCEFAGKRLPTEAEWEKAARGTDRRTYPWGNEDPSCDRLNYNIICKSDTTPVGSYPNGASPYGVMDMVGNVWEWTSSDYKPYPYKSDDGREGLLKNNKKVLRGGSSFSNGNDERVTSRVSLATSNWNKDFGGRCARSVSPTPTPTPTTTPKPQKPTTLTPTSHTAPDGMILIRAGEFIMGNDAGAKDEKPAHAVYLADFYIDKYKVSEGQYAFCVKRNKCTFAFDSYLYNSAVFPMSKVDWQQAKDYCESVGKRLPTEAEWEKAAKAVNELIDSQSEMWEWTSSDYESYPYQSDDGRENDISGQAKVIRGGGHWSESEVKNKHLRISKRRVGLGSGTSQIGFRCADSIP